MTFKIAYILADRWLADMKLSGRIRKTAAVRHMDEYVEFIVIDHSNTCYVNSPSLLLIHFLSLHPQSMQIQRSAVIFMTASRLCSDINLYTPFLVYHKNYTILDSADLICEDFKTDKKVVIGEHSIHQ